MSESLLPVLPCMCGTLRRTSRSLSQLYESALRPLGLRATQFTILQALARTGEVSQGDLAEFLAIDSTTLTRTLEIMRSQGWVTVRRSKDRRERRLSLDKDGEKLLQGALPVWEKVQRRLRRQLGEQNWKKFLQFANHVTRIVMTQGASK